MSILPADVEGIIMDYKEDLDNNHDMIDDLDLSDFKTKEQYKEEQERIKQQLKEERERIKQQLENEQANLKQQLTDFFEEHRDYFEAMERKINEKVKLKESHRKLLEEYNHLGFWDYQKLKYRLRKQLKQIKKEIKVYKKQILQMLKESGIKWENFKKMKYDTFDYTVEEWYCGFSLLTFGPAFMITSIVLVSILLPPVGAGFLALIIIGHIACLPLFAGWGFGILLGIIVMQSIRLPVFLYNYLTRKTKILNIIKKFKN